MTLTPSGGTSNLPALVNGTPGLPPGLTVNVTTLAAGANATASLTQTNPGGPGVASAYTLALGIPAGATGSTGPSTTISTAPDVEGGPVGASTDGYTLYYSNADSKWKISAPKVPSGPYICLNSSFTAYSGTSTSATIATIGVPALPYAWRPMVSAGIYAAGTVNTHVDLAVYLGSATGQQVAYGMGQSGGGPYAIHATSAFGANVSGSSTYGQVAANTAATFFLQALQLNSTTDTWSTLNTNGFFTIWAIPT